MNKTTKLIKYIFIFLIAEYFLSCTENKSSTTYESTNQIKTESNIKTQVIEKPKICPSISNPGEKFPSKYEVSINDEKKLIVCGELTSFEKDIFTEFNVYQADSNKTIGLPIASYDATENVRVSEKNGKLELEELLYVKEKWIPTFKIVISCHKDFCEPSPSTCIFKKLTHESDTNKEFYTYVNGPNKGKVPDSYLIVNLLQSALSGDKQAQSVFLNKPKNLRLDGDSAEQFSYFTSVISKLKKSNCY